MSGLTKVLYMILALFASILLWIYVVGVERPEKEEVISNIPVIFVGEQELQEDFSLIITGGKRSTVSLTVRGSYMDIASLNTDKDSIEVKANLMSISTEGTKVLTYDVTLPRGSNLTIIDQSPMFLEITLEKIYTRAVEVRFKDEGSRETDFLVKQHELNPGSLQITGPRATVDEIAYAEVVWTRQNQNQTLVLDLDYKLYNADGGEISTEGITANYDVINVTLPVQKTKEVPLTVEIQPGGGATEADINREVSPKSIIIAGDPSVIDAINSIPVGIIKLGEMFGTGGTKQFPILIPDGVENLSGEAECDVTISIHGLKTTALTCENITYIDKPDNVEVNIITQQIAITIRGKEEEVQVVTAGHIRVVVDLDGIDTTEGRKSVPATVYIDGVSSVGVVGTYMVALEYLASEAGS